MLKYVYNNAIVYITKPTETHIRKIQNATKEFMQRVMKERCQHESRRHN